VSRGPTSSSRRGEEDTTTPRRHMHQTQRYNYATINIKDHCVLTECLNGSRSPALLVYMNKENKW
jgi:hypothetical protein